MIRKEQQRPCLRRALCLLLSLFLCLVQALPARAADWPTLSATIEAEGAILIDADSGAVLYGKNEHTAYYPASITKVLTAIVVLENVTQLDDMVTFSFAATNTNLDTNSTVIGAVAGDQLSVRDCLYSLLLHSANDCANALAEYVAGSNAAFAALMNEKAAAIGCTDSHFMNPSGLNDSEHYTSCADMAKILQYAIQNPTFRQIDSTQVYTHGPIAKYPEGDSHNTIYAHHRMMRKSYSEYYPGVFAGKTGYTMAAGNTLVTACERDGMTLIAVILNGHNSQYRDSKALFDFGYDQFSSPSVSEKDNAYTAIGNHFSVDGISLVDALEFSIDEKYHVTLPKAADFSEAESSLSYDLTDAEKADGSVARIDYRFAGRDVGHAYVQLLDRSEEREAGARDAAAVEAKVQETVPETIAVDKAQQDDADKAGAGTDDAADGHMPVLLDRDSGRIVIRKPLLLALLVLSGIAAAALLIFLLIRLIAWLREARKKHRRNRLLRHTRELTREQKARRDMMLKKRKAKRRRR